MNEPFAEAEIAREGRRVFRKLMAEGAMLAPGHGDYSARIAGGRGRPSMRVASAMVEAFRRRGWLVPAAQTDDAYTLSDAGLFWLRRALAHEDPFAAQHQLRVKRLVTDDQGIEQLVTVNEGESPLAWLYNRRGLDGKKLIGRVQFEAGELLRRDFTLAQLTPRMAVDLSAPVIGEKRGVKADPALTETVLAAKQRFSRALDFAGPGLADLLIDVCCRSDRPRRSRTRPGLAQALGKNRVANRARPPGHPLRALSAHRPRLAPHSRLGRAGRKASRTESREKRGLTAIREGVGWAVRRGATEESR